MRKNDVDEKLHSLFDRICRWRNVVFLFLIFSFFILGFLDRKFREDQFAQRQTEIFGYLNGYIELQGRVVSYPVPADKTFSYLIETSRLNWRNEWLERKYKIQILSKTYQAPDKGDVIHLKTKLYLPQFQELNRKVKQIDAYGTVYGDRYVNILTRANTHGTSLRMHIFENAQTHMNAKNYGYFRAMVFGDQALLGQKTIDRLKETGLLHLFVVSGSHILFACALGFWILRCVLSWVPGLHRYKRFISLLRIGSIAFVFGFLYLINPPISSFRAVGTMILFVLLQFFKRPRNALWNLGFIFFITLAFNPIYLFDVSTQLTFASVAGILCFCSLYRRWEEDRGVAWIVSYIAPASMATLGAGIFTLPILYLQFGTFYPLSLLYNLILVPTIGSLVSFLSVASLVWVCIPIDFFQKIGFGTLDILFSSFEKILFFQPYFQIESSLNPVFTAISRLWWIWLAGTVGVAFIITQRLLKKRIFLK